MVEVADVELFEAKTCDEYADARLQPSSGLLPWLGGLIHVRRPGAPSVTPGAVVRKAYLAANRGRFAEANRLVTAKAVASVWEARKKVAKVLGLQVRRSDRYGTWKGLTRGCSIRKLVVRQERVRGRYA